MRLGSTIGLRAFLVRSDGSRGEASGAEWGSWNAAILTINSVTGVASAVGVGTVDVVVRAGGFTARKTIDVLPPTSTTSGALTIDSFSVIEFEYPSAPGQKYYAPQVLVRAASTTAVTVLTLGFHIPGLLDPIPVIDCRGHVPAGETRQLNGEVYGDWAFALFGPGRAASGEPVTMSLIFVDATGDSGMITMTGPVVPGSLPEPDSSGASVAACFL
jgi:hypothetical protein